MSDPVMNRLVVQEVEASRPPVVAISNPMGDTVLIKGLGLEPGEYWRDLALDDDAVKRGVVVLEANMTALGLDSDEVFVPSIVRGILRAAANPNREQP